MLMVFEADRIATMRKRHEGQTEVKGKMDEGIENKDSRSKGEKQWIELEDAGYEENE